MINFRLIKTALFGALLVANSLSTAHAQANSARAEITGFTVQLFDLDPSDGILPSLSFASQSQHSHYSVTGDGLFDLADTYGFGSVARDDTAGALFSQVASDALSSRVEGRMTDTSFLASSDWFAQFHLSPATAVVFRALTRVDSMVWARGEGLSQAGMSGDLGGTGGFYSWLVGNAGAPPAANEGILYGELRSGSEGADGSLSMYTSARIVTSPVPEPGSWAMLLAGLGIAAGLALRIRGRGIRRQPGPGRARGLARGLAPGLAAVLALTAGGAAAQSSASVSMGTWRYTLTDLAPLDGIAPGITLAPQSSSPAYRSIAWHGRPMEEGQDWQGETNDTGAPLYWERDGNTASAWSLPSGIETAVHSVGTPVLAYGMREFSFTLTPFTQVAFFQDGHQASSGTVGVPGARARLAVTLNNYPAGAAGWDESELVGDGERDFTLFAAAASQGESAAGIVNLQATSYVLVAVPEPAQYAMWLAGMGLLFAYRRRGPRE
jgi:hypothetical protein